MNWVDRSMTNHPSPITLSKTFKTINSTPSLQHKQPHILDPSERPKVFLLNWRHFGTYVACGRPRAGLGGQRRLLSLSVTSITAATQLDPPPPPTTPSSILSIRSSISILKVVVKYQVTSITAATQL